MSIQDFFDIKPPFWSFGSVRSRRIYARRSGFRVTSISSVCGRSRVVMHHSYEHRVPPGESACDGHVPEWNSARGMACQAPR